MYMRFGSVLPIILQQMLVVEPENRPDFICLKEFVAEFPEI